MRISARSCRPPDRERAAWINPGRKRNRFTKEFKLEAVRLLDRGVKG
jgi:hypothetical protein